MCRVAPRPVKVLVCSSWDQECWPILLRAQVLFEYQGYQHDFVLGWSILLGNASTEDKLDPSVKNCYLSQVQDLHEALFSSFIFCSVLPFLEGRTL